MDTLTNADKLDITAILWHTCANKVVLNYVDKFNFQIQNGEREYYLVSKHGTTEALAHRLKGFLGMVEYDPEWTDLMAEYTQFYKEFTGAIRSLAMKAGRKRYPVLCLTWEVAERNTMCNDIDADLFEGVNPEIDRIFAKYMLMGDYL